MHHRSHRPLTVILMAAVGLAALAVLLLAGSSEAKRGRGFSRLNGAAIDVQRVCRDGLRFGYALEEEIALSLFPSDQEIIDVAVTAEHDGRSVLADSPVILRVERWIDLIDTVGNGEPEWHSFIHPFLRLHWELPPGTEVDLAMSPLEGATPFTSTVKLLVEDCSLAVSPMVHTVCSDDVPKDVFPTRRELVACDKGFLNGAVSSLAVTRSLTIADLDLAFFGTFEQPREISVTLRSPAGTELAVLEAASFSPQADSGEGYGTTCDPAPDFALSDEGIGYGGGESSLQNSEPPYTVGPFRPVGDLLAGVDGENGQGEWELGVCDRSFYGGQLNCWCLEFEEAPQSDLAATVSVSTDGATCSPNTSATVRTGDPVYYCVTLENRGQVPLTRHRLVEAGLGISTTLETTLAPGAMVTFTASGPSTPPALAAQLGPYTATVPIDASFAMTSTAPGLYVESRRADTRVDVKLAGDLTVTKSVDWNGVPVDSDAGFRICISGPSYPDSSCRETGPNGGMLTWADLLPGSYVVTETDPGPAWERTITGSPAQVVDRETTQATVANRHRLGSLQANVTVDWQAGAPDPDALFRICITGPSHPGGNCRSTAINGGALTWDNLIPGDYQATMETPDWSIEWIGGAITVTPGQVTAVSLRATGTPQEASRETIFLPWLNQ